MDYGEECKTPGLFSKVVYKKFLDVFAEIRDGNADAVESFLVFILRHSSPMLPGTDSSQLP